MERRNFLSLVASSAAAAGVSATPLGAAVSAEPPLPPARDLDEYVARFDAGFERIGRWAPTEGRDGELDTLAQLSLQSMFVTGMLGDLPLPEQADDRVQQRVFRAIPVMDEAQDRMATYLASRGDDELAAVQATLRSAEVRAGVIDALDAEARRTGVSAPRRAQLREMLGHVTWRLAHQPPRLIVDEYQEKVTKLTETDLESEARQRELAARIGEDAFWQLQHEKSARDRRIARGAKAMGVGFLITGAGGLAVAAGAFPGVFVMTVGVIWMLVGLIILLSGLATPQPEPTAR